MFVAMFKLMWYMMILCGWLFYAICYGIIWCIKRIIKSSRKKQSINKAYNVSKQSTNRPVVEEDVLIVPNEIQKHLDEKSNQSELSQDQEHENTQQTVQKASIHTDDEDVLVVSNDIKIHLQKNSNNKKPEDQPPRKKPSVARWIIGGIFAMFAFVNGLHVSSLLLLGAAFMMFPLPFINKFFQKANIKPTVAVILSIALLFVGIITSSSFETADTSSNESTQTTQNNTENKNETNGTPYSNLKAFISKYNKIAIYDIKGTKKIDIQSSQYYRTEFRLPAFKNATAYNGKIGENSIQIINYNRKSSLGSSIRIYISVDIVQQAEEIFEAFCKACNPDIKKSDLKEFYSLHSLDSQYGCSINFKGISGYINKTSDGFDIMLEASPEYFDN